MLRFVDLPNLRGLVKRNTSVPPPPGKYVIYERSLIDEIQVQVADLTEILDADGDLAHVSETVRSVKSVTFQARRWTIHIRLNVHDDMGCIVVMAYVVVTMAVI